ncbi:MAG: hypothetical protein Kow0077_32570 [Anaerolineae bacterium]
MDTVPQYESGRKFSTWLLSITSHYCIDQLRRRRLFWVSLEDELLPAGTLASHQPGPEQRVLQSEREAEVQTLLKTLPENYRMAVILRYWYDMTYEEIAETTGDSVSAIKSRLFRARNMLANAVHSEAHLALMPA